MVESFATDFSCLCTRSTSRMLAFGSLLSSITAKSQLYLDKTRPQERNAASNFRNYSTAPGAESTEQAPVKRNIEAEMLHNSAVRKEMGAIASSRKVSRTKGNYKFLLGTVIIFGAIYYYSIWKVGQDDFSDVDAQGNIREKV